MYADHHTAAELQHLINVVLHCTLLSNVQRADCTEMETTKPNNIANAGKQH